MWKLFSDSFFKNKGYVDFFIGLKNTFIIALCGLLIGIILGVLIASVKVAPSKNPIVKFLKGFSEVYIAIFRGTPIIVQLLLVYYVLFPALGIRADRIMIAVVTFGLNSAAYVSEIVRGGINSVDSGQMEAARSLGLGYMRAMWHVVIPQAFKNIIPTLGNEFIVLIKETSVVSFIAIVDITMAFKSIATNTYEYVIPYCMLAITYLVIVIGFTFIIKAVEKRMNKSDRRS